MHGEVRLRVTLTAHSRPWTRVPANRACGAWDTCVCVRRRASAAARATRDPRRPEMCVGRALMPGAPTRPCMGKPDLAHVPRRVWTWWHAIRVWPCPSFGVVCAMVLRARRPVWKGGRSPAGICVRDHCVATQERGTWFEWRAVSTSLARSGPRLVAGGTTRCGAVGEGDQHCNAGTPTSACLLQQVICV